MVLINKEEKEALVRRFPDIHIVRTMRTKSKRHHYYVEENKYAMRYLNRLRGLSSSDQRKGGGGHR